jgi:inositol transporter-like SP family MFS transporter
LACPGGYANESLQATSSYSEIETKMTARLGDATTGREIWKNTILAGLANYIDSGSIVAGAAALALWADLYNLSPSFVGVIGAFSANAIAAGVGALIGGRLCDLFGRKRIYQYDMLFYAFGMLWLIFASQPWMIVLGFVLVGLAVGADIPASWSLIAEMAPGNQRGKHCGVAQLLWMLGPLVVLLMFLVVAPLGVLGARIVFAHLLVLALLLTFLRSRMRESPIWAAAKLLEEQRGACQEAQSARLSRLCAPQHLKSMAFLIGMYGIWNLWAGTDGFFFPYIQRTIGGQSQTAAMALQAACCPFAIASTVFIFMRFSDRFNQRLLFGISISIQIIAVSLLAVFPLTLLTVILYLFLTSFASGFGAQAFFQLWSAELFPTLLRSTAQGFTFAVVRIALGLWSFFVPVLASAQFTTLAWMLTGFLVVSGLIGVIWAPRNNQGKSLEQIEAEKNAKEGAVKAAAESARYNQHSLSR